MGKDNDHLRFTVRKSTGKKGQDYKEITYATVAFNFGHLTESLKNGDSVDIIYAF